MTTLEIREKQLAAALFQIAIQAAQIETLKEMLKLRSDEPPSGKWPNLETKSH